jgi:hypothetical protein
MRVKCRIKDSALEDLSTDEIRDALARIATIRTFIGSYAAADGDGISPPKTLGNVRELGVRHDRRRRAPELA